MASIRRHSVFLVLLVFSWLSALLFLYSNKSFQRGEFNNGLFSVRYIPITHRRNKTSRRCSGLVKPLADHGRQGFQKIGRGIYAFSAFYDDRIKAVRIIAGVPVHKRTVSYCQLWFLQFDDVMITDSTTDTTGDRFRIT